MRTIIAIVQIIVAMLAIFALVLWEKRDRDTNWLVSLFLIIPMLLVPQIFEDGSDNYALCMHHDDDESKGEPSIYANTESERLAPAGQMYSESLITPPTDSIYHIQPVEDEQLASYQGLGRHNWFYDTSRHWPEPPMMRRSSLLPVPQNDLFVWSTIGSLTEEIVEEGTEVDILRQIGQHIPQGKPIYYGLVLPIPTSLNEFILMYDNLLHTKLHVSKDIAHLHLNIDTNQTLISKSTEILGYIDQNKDLLDSVYRWKHRIVSDVWQQSHRSVGIGPAHIDREFERTIAYMDSAHLRYHREQYGQDLTRGFWPNGSEENDPNKFVSHPGYNPMVRRLRTLAIIATVSGITYQICDNIFDI
jgi:hypothetical protein